MVRTFSLAGERGPNRWASTRQQTPTARRKSGERYQQGHLFALGMAGKMASGATAGRLRGSGYPRLSPALRGPADRNGDDEIVAQQGRQRTRPSPANPGRRMPKGPSRARRRRPCDPDARRPLVTTLLARDDTDQGRSSAFRVNLRDGCTCLSTTWAVESPVSRSRSGGQAPAFLSIESWRAFGYGALPRCLCAHPPVHRQPVEAPPVPGPIGLGQEAGERV